MKREKDREKKSAILTKHPGAARGVFTRLSGVWHRPRMATRIKGEAQPLYPLMTREDIALVSAQLMRRARTPLH